MYSAFLLRSELPERFQRLVTSIVVFSLMGAGLQAQSDASDPYTLRFEDFNWKPSGELAEIAGAMPLGGPNPIEKSLAIFAERVERNPLDVASRVVLGELLLKLAKDEDALAAYAESEMVLRQAIDLAPDSLAAQVALANTLLATHQFTAALEIAERVVAAKPEHAAGLAVRFDSLLELGRYNETQDAITALLAAEQSPPVWARQARLSELTGDPAGAVAHIERCIGVEPANAWYRWRKGELLFAQGSLKPAQASFEQALALEPDDAASMVGLAKCAFAMDDRRTALEKLTLALENHGGPPVMSLLGDYYARQSDSAQANSWYDKAENAMLEEAKIAGDAHARELVMFLADHGRDLNRARALATKDLERRQDIYAFDTLAWVQYRLGEGRAAVENMENALDLETRDPLLMYHASLIYESVGEREKAEEQQAKLMDTNPRFSILYAEPLSKSSDKSEAGNTAPVQNGAK